jgi:putative tryptophan/tyrosine transport system substrate-binding protein
VRRREFIAGLGSAAAWPLAARAQQGDRVRRIGVLMPGDENDPALKTYVSAFAPALADLGWTDGRNVRMDFRWAGGDINRIRALAQELVGLQPNIIVASSTAVTAALQRETRTIPIVMVNVSDPVGSGFAAQLSQPGENITGFGLYEASIVGKQLELLLEIAPGLRRAAIMFNPDTAPVLVYMPSFETATRSLGVRSIVAPVHNVSDIETVMTSLGRGPAVSVVLMPDVFVYAHRARIISLAAQYGVPTIHFYASWVRNGGLLSYGPDYLDLYRRAGTYVDRILRGAKPADLPVQLPTKFEMVVNLKTANVLGLTIPPNLLAIADEVIE